MSTPTPCASAPAPPTRPAPSGPPAAPAAPVLVTEAAPGGGVGDGNGVGPVLVTSGGASGSVGAMPPPPPGPPRWPDRTSQFAPPEGAVLPPPPPPPVGGYGGYWPRGGWPGGPGGPAGPGGVRARRRPVPPARPLVVGWVVVAAALADLAIRLPVGTLAATLLALCLVGLLAATGGLRSVTQLVAGGLVAAAATAFVLRASPWVGWITSSAVATLVVLAAADGFRADRGPTWIRSARAWVESAVAVPAWLAGLFERLPRVGPGRAGQVFRAALAAGTVLLVLGGLLASGDAVFGAVLTSVNPGSGLSHLVVTTVFAFPVAAVAVLALRSHGANASADGAVSSDGAVVLCDTLSPGGSTAASRTVATGAGPRPGGRLVVESLAARWATAGLLSVWCGVQLVVVSGGAREVIKSQGLTVAEYTRQGFFQLVAVAALSLAVLNLTHRFLVGLPGATPALGPADAAAVDGASIDGAANDAAGRSGTALSRQAPAVVIGVALMALVAATFARLVYYLDSYGLTMLRLAVGTFLGWLALMTVLSVARSLGVAAGRSWLQSATVLSAAAVAVAYAWANPAAVVARVNLDRAADAAASGQAPDGGDTADRRGGDGPLDVDYLLMLGPDARGPLTDFDWSVLGGRPDAVTRFLCDGGDGSTGYGPFGWNRSRAVLADPDPALGC